MTPVVAGRGKDPAPDAECLLVCSVESPEIASSLSFRLPAKCWELLVPLPDEVLRLPTGTAGFLLRAIGKRSSFNRAGDI